MAPLRALACTIAAVLYAAAAAAQVDARLSALSDAPDPTYQRAPALAGPATYAEALRRWKSAEAVNAWLGSNFSYDSARALELSESARAAGAKTSVLEPQSFFAEPRGVCIDMARFAVTALRHIEPQSQAAYLMIEFEPVQVSGQVLRRHWLATFQRDGGHYFFADSKRPGHMAGPYSSVESFVAEYSTYRSRAVVTHKVLPGYERRLRTQSLRAVRNERANPGHPLERP